MKREKLHLHTKWPPLFSYHQTQTLLDVASSHLAILVEDIFEISGPTALGKAADEQLGRHCHRSDRTTPANNVVVGQSSFAHIDCSVL